MVDVLENKRSATRFRILVEIADRQPAVSQGEIAEAVGVTSQAVSEYIRDLVEEGFVEKEGRSRYRVTKEGVDWVFQSANDMRRFVDHVTDDVLGSVQEDAAIADAEFAAGETVSLSLEAGLLHAGPQEGDGATGVTTTDAAAGEVVGVTGFEGVIDLEPGHVSVVQVPTVRTDSDGSGADIAATCAGVPIVTAAGVEAVSALRDAGVEPTTYFAPGAVAADAASRGLDAVVVATQDTIGRVTDALTDASVSYDVAK
ncbi:MarR family transcriptional regulator [Haloarcula salinisoli]|uniref:Winged helix-turn-helix transcriptional regulator n=1 Tax=Haloarcula salinisoli TaxID=2487746 RepID=A0A8J7YGG5_9EURY|nr:MarR family transcriptional regulator [Halomicroarcula salinisoli]MBX0285645.1 winged helix-turn-helix transcriptional regulator [Halomicroarcula salinisoli]MBX0302866.1 winged helix-turn-helix transcriptional regulator [Halomicroarcula salinisoli]